MQVTREFTATHVCYVLPESTKMMHMFVSIVQITVIQRVVLKVCLIVNAMQDSLVPTAVHVQLAPLAHTK